MSLSILLIDCPDEKGLIHKITGVLKENELNIMRNDEFVERSTNQFFMRIECSGIMDAVKVNSELSKILPSGAFVRFSTSEKKKIVILVTKEPHCIGDLLMRNHFGELNAEIQAVISNHENLGNLISKFGIPFHHVPHENKSREDHEDELLTMISGYDPEVLILAKYMRVLSPEFIKSFSKRIINIHHSFLPSFKGSNPYKQAFEKGVKIIGATSHFVTNELDEGPIIAQSIIPVDHNQNAAEMARAGADIEKLVLAHSLRLILDERVFINGNKTIIFE